MGEWAEVISRIGFPIGVALVLLYGFAQVGKWAARLFESQQEAIRENTKAMRDGFEQMTRSVEDLIKAQESRTSELDVRRRKNE